MKCLLAVVVGLLGMSQDVDNPQFKYWNGCKSGSWVKMRMEMNQAGQKIESETTHTLLELKDDVAVVEITGKSKFGDKEFPLPAQKQEIKAKESADKIKIAAEGDEEIEVAGKKLKCDWTETETEINGAKTVTRVYTNHDIPGFTAKMTVKSPTMSMTSDVVEYASK